MEPDTLKKQTCYRESVYILLFPSLSLSASLLAPLSRLTVTWLFHFTVSVAMVVKRENQGSQPIPSDRNSLCVCQWLPFWSILFRCTAEMWIQRTGHNRTRRGMNFNPTHRNHPNKSPRVPWSKTKSSRRSTYNTSWEWTQPFTLWQRFWHTDNKAEFKSQSLPLVIS